MDIPFLITLLFLGLGGGFLSGLLGLGGAIFMIPLLLYVPPLLGVGLLDMKQVAAVSMVQVLSASLSGLIVHNKNRFVSKSIFIYMGTANAIGNLAGSLVSKQAKSAFLLAIFATLAVIAAVVMFIPKREQGQDIAPEDLKYNKPLAVAVSLLIGCFRRHGRCARRIYLHSCHDLPAEYTYAHCDRQYTRHRLYGRSHRHDRQNGDRPDYLALRDSPGYRHDTRSTIRRAGKQKDQHQVSEIRYCGDYCNNRSEDVVSDTYGALGLRGKLIKMLKKVTITGWQYGKNSCFRRLIRRTYCCL